MPHKRLKNIRILLVEDEPILLKLISDVLVHLGFSNLVKVDNGKDAMHKIKTEFFDMIITDWRMPELKGIDLIRFIRSSGECAYPRVPIILLTGNSGTKYIFEARDAGVTEYIVKPFSAQQLVKRIQSIIEKPRSFIEASTYAGPNRRFHDVEIDGRPDRRQRAA